MLPTVVHFPSHGTPRCWRRRRRCGVSASVGNSRGARLPAVQQSGARRGGRHSLARRVAGGTRCALDTLPVLAWVLMLPPPLLLLLRRLRNRMPLLWCKGRAVKSSSKVQVRRRQPGGRWYTHHRTIHCVFCPSFCGLRKLGCRLPSAVGLGWCHVQPVVRATRPRCRHGGRHNAAGSTRKGCRYVHSTGWWVKGAATAAHARVGEATRRATGKIWRVDCLLPAVCWCVGADPRD